MRFEVRGSRSELRGGSDSLLVYAARSPPIPRFPHTIAARRIFAIFLSGRVCYFLRISFEKLEENTIGKEKRMLDENRVQKMLKKRGEPADSRCKAMCKGCGFPAAK